MDMKTIFYTTYILMWPALSLGVLTYIVTAVIRDAIRAKKKNKSII